MAEPTLVQVFGTGATQDSSSITIQKSALPRLTASSSNSAESLLVGIFLAAMNYLTQTNFDANTDQSLILGDGFSSFTTRGQTQYRLDQLTLSLAKIDTGSTINPGDY
ncbi:hypothetical protein [Nostoc sp. 'Lobaria pulmonaria (5183) cyanobiont']|uniref:hypothetical protein n=1 Tax=Nostoc sp. 'Lobaria pulmonaria (5183) cyanobiont' TaxID=1618022 RepID=UPI000CF35D59|nr:hypothetical protein [Nostoc sp. 'Lobaria pulmonaria (5183) cyanobiont']AVH71583.1 hypothetical protein NLP_2993 [Nostoc sp. 'Lobaria pulmonaria (5183) cyanobiont']